MCHFSGYSLWWSKRLNSGESWPSLIRATGGGWRRRKSGTERWKRGWFSGHICMHTSAESVWCRQRPKADVWLGGATVQIRQSGVNYRKFLACDLFMWNKKSVVGSECQRAAQEWHEPAATDVLHRMCAALLRPAVTHQTAGQAWGKYEVTGPPLASPSHTHTHTQTAPSTPATAHSYSVKANQQEWPWDANLRWLSHRVAAGDKHDGWLQWR